MRRVILESPFAGNVEMNRRYARAAMLDCLRRGEAPIASHLLYTQVLDDLVPADRALGIAAGLTWSCVADAAVFYTDLGWSSGMEQARVFHVEQGRLIEARIIPSWWSDPA